MFATDCISQISSKKYIPRRNSEFQSKASPVYIAETIPKQYFDQHRVQNVSIISSCFPRHFPRRKSI